MFTSCAIASRQCERFHAVNVKITAQTRGLVPAYWLSSGQICLLIQVLLWSLFCVVRFWSLCLWAMSRLWRFVLFSANVPPPCGTTSTWPCFSQTSTFKFCGAFSGAGAYPSVHPGQVSTEIFKGTLIWNEYWSETENVFHFIYLIKLN